MMGDWLILVCLLTSFHAMQTHVMMIWSYYMHNRRVLHLTLTMSMTQSSLFVLHYVLPLFRYLLATFLYVIIMLSMHINDLVKFCDINTWVYLNINVFIRNLETFRHPTCICTFLYCQFIFSGVHYAPLRKPAFLR